MTVDDSTRVRFSSFAFGSWLVGFLRMRGSGGGGPQGGVGSTYYLGGLLIWSAMLASGRAQQVPAGTTDLDLLPIAIESGD